MPPDSPLVSESVLSPDQLPPGVHQELFTLWLGKCTSDRLPGRADFDPREMPGLLPHITLFDVERAPIRFRIRLVGTAIVDAMGLDTTGMYLDELDNIDAVQQRAETMSRTREPYFLDGLPLTWTHQNYKNYSTLGCRWLPTA